MPYNIQLPNGVTVQVADNVPEEQARLMIVREYPELFKRNQGFMPALKAGWDTTAGNAQAGIADLAEQAGFENVGKWFKEASDNNRKEVAAEYDPTTSEDVAAAKKKGVLSGIGALARQYATEPVGQMAGSLGPSVIGAGAGSVVGMPQLGFALPYLADRYGSNIEAQKEQGGDINRLGATAAAIAQTALGMYGFGKMVNGVVGSGLAMREASKLAPKVLSGEMTQEAATHAVGSTLRNVAAETAGSAVVNIGSGVGDEALRRAQAGMPIDDQEAQDAYKHIATTGAVLAPVFGALHGTGARGKALSKLSDAEKIKTIERQRVEDAEQETERAASEAEQAFTEPQPVVVDPNAPASAPTPEAAAALLKEQIGDSARRAVEQRDQPGLEERRADAEAAFAGAEPKPADLVPNGLLAPEDTSVGERRAPAPEPVADPNQNVLPLANEHPLRPDFQLEPTEVASKAPPPPEPKPAPVLTKKEDFADIFYPRAAAMKDGRLEGHDLSTLEGARALRKAVKGYALEDSPANEPRIAARDALVEKVDAIIAQIKAKQLELPLKENKNAVDFPTPVEPVSPMEPAHATETAAPSVHNPEPRPASVDMGQRDQQQAVPEQLPSAEQRTTGSSDVPTAERVRFEGDSNRSLTDLQQRAKFGRDSGAVVDAGGNYLKGRQNAALGKAMEAGDFEGVVSALANSKNEFIKHVGEQAAKLEGVKVKVDEGSETHTVDGVIKRDTESARINQAVYEALRDHVDEVKRTGKIPEEFWSQPVPLADGIGGTPREPTFKNTFDSKMVDTPQKFMQQYNDLKTWNEKNGGDARIHDYINNKVESTGAHGTFDPSTNTATAQPHKIKDEHTVAHELVHAMVHHAIDAPTKEQKYFVDKLKRLHEYVRGVMRDREWVPEDGTTKKVPARDYGLTDVHEFVSEAMTNPDFQQKLSKIKYQNTTAWGKFTSYIAKLLGLKNDNAFTEFLANYEGMEKADGGLKAVKSDTPVKNLGAYRDSAVPELERGPIGHAADALKNARSLGTKTAATGLKDRAIVELFDIQHGITRHLVNAWTRATATGKEATARALLQHSTYGTPLARESLSVGTVKKNAEGFWKLERKSENFKSYLDAVQALPTNEDKLRVANGIHTNLAYAEREAMLVNNKAGAQGLIAQARQEFQQAKQLKGAAAAQMYRSAVAKRNMYDDIMDKNYKRPPSVTDATIRQALADEQTPEVKKMLDAARAINHQTIDIMHEGGIISDETAKLWKNNKFYVPLQRMMDDDVNTSNMLTAQGGARTKDIKAFKGSEREVQDITENMIKQRTYAVDAAMRNNAHQKALQELMADPGNPAGVRKLGDRPAGDNWTTVKENGQKQYYEVNDPMALQTFRGIIQDAPGIADKLEHITKFFREAVMLSPDAIWRNIVRDTADVWSFGASDKNALSLTANIFSQFAKSFPGIVREGFGTKLHQPHYEVSSFGIAGQKEFTSLDAERKTIVREQLRKTGTKDWAAAADGIIDGVAKLIKPLQNLAIEGELAPRNHVFKNVLARTGSETEAAMAAINTLDFRRRGAWSGITAAKKTIPFFNSQLQGWYKLATALAGDNLSSGLSRDAAMRMLYIKGAKMAAAAWLYQTVMQEDPDYMEVKKDIRDMNVLVPAGSDDSGKTIFMKVPLPHEYGSLFWTIPSNITSWLTNHQNGHETLDALSAAAGRAAPGLLPQFAKPAIEYAANFNFYTGKSLENESMQRMDPSHRFNDSTSEVAKAAGDALGLSPVKLDNLLRGYLGSLGMVSVQVLDKLLEDGKAAEVPGYRAPILRSLLTDPMSSASRDKFYELKAMIEQVHNTANSMKAKPQEALSYLGKETNGVPNKTLYDMHRGVQQLDKDMQSATKREKEIKASDLSPAMKRAQLEHVRKLMNFKLQKAMPTLRTYMGEDVAVPEVNAPDAEVE